ncbi:hypothetical protein ACFXOM_08960 [Streptomyces sp. NPDC059169]|uniref:hypothetical protein n=1 Tax=unclassified Streptomyces TaxID=2593676 RepID=UPI0036952C8A
MATGPSWGDQFVLDYAEQSVASVVGLLEGRGLLPGCGWMPQLEAGRYLPQLAAVEGVLEWRVIARVDTAVALAAHHDAAAQEAPEPMSPTGTGPPQQGRPVPACRNAERVELHPMPVYSPEPHRDELLNADLKHHAHGARAASPDGLAHDTRRFLRRRQKQPHIVCGYFTARHVRYAIQ